LMGWFSITTPRIWLSLSRKETSTYFIKTVVCFATPRTHRSPANALARKFAQDANTLANTKDGEPRWPSNALANSSLLPFQVCQRATNRDGHCGRALPVFPLDPLRLSRAFATPGPAPSYAMEPQAVEREQPSERNKNQGERIGSTWLS
jgi:hypothetical protein